VRPTPRGAEWLTPWATRRDFSSLVSCQECFGSKTPSAHATVGQKKSRITILYFVFDREESLFQVSWLLPICCQLHGNNVNNRRKKRFFPCLGYSVDKELSYIQYRRILKQLRISRLGWGYRAAFPGEFMIQFWCNCHGNNGLYG